MAVWRKEHLLWAGFVFALVVSTGVSSAQECPVSYRTRGFKPLMFGGLNQGTCEKNCKSRDDYWGGQVCKFDTSAGLWGVCTEEQREKGWPYFESFRGGEAIMLKPCELWPYLRGRTLWIMGDSYAKDLYKALQCFLIDFWDHQECRASTDEQLTRQLFNLPVQTGESKCFHMPGKTRICMVRTVLGQQYVSDRQLPNGGVLPFLYARFAEPQDIFMVNFGVWHRKRGEQGWQQMDKALEDMVAFYQRTKSRFPHLMFKETPMDHPKDMEKGVCLPHNSVVYDRGFGGLVPNPAARTTSGTGLLSGSRVNANVRKILPAGGVAVFGRAGFDMSVALHHQHIGMNGVSDIDCLHYCQPGLPQMWIYEFYEAVKGGLADVRPLRGNPASEMFTCVPQKGN